MKFPLDKKNTLRQITSLFTLLLCLTTFGQTENYEAFAKTYLKAINEKNFDILSDQLDFQGKLKSKVNCFVNTDTPSFQQEYRRRELELFNEYLSKLGSKSSFFFVGTKRLTLSIRDKCEKKTMTFEFIFRISNSNNESHTIKLKGLQSKKGILLLH